MVFCKHCKYYKRLPWGTFHTEICRKEYTIEHDHRGQWKEYANPAHKNLYNDCPDYEPKWYIKILEFFKKYKDMIKKEIKKGGQNNVG